MSCTVAPACTTAVVGETETVIAGGGGGITALEEPPHPKLAMASVTKSKSWKNNARFFELITCPRSDWAFPDTAYRGFRLHILLKQQAPEGL